MNLKAVNLPTLADTAPRLMALRAEAREASSLVMIGGLVTRFSNDELRLLADSFLSIGEVSTLRKLGVLGRYEGYDGGRFDDTGGDQ